MTDRQREIIESLDWTIHSCEYSGNVAGYELQKYSPAGEDFLFSVEADNLVENIKEYAANFDINEHVAMWIQADHEKVSGIPSAVELVDDARAIDKMLKELAEALFNDEIKVEDGGEESTIYGTTHVVELWIKRPYKVYVEDSDGSMSEGQIKTEAIKRAIDSEDNMTLSDGIEIEEQDILSVEYQYDIDD